MGIMRCHRNRTVVGIIVGTFLICGMFIQSEATANQQSTHLIDPGQEELFPLPASLRPAVEFWCKTFSEWRMDQVVLHDEEHLGVIYRILEIPGPVDEGLTVSQRQWVRSQETLLASELSSVYSDLAAGRRLDKDGQELANAIERGNGRIEGASGRVRSQRGVRERFLRGLEISGGYIDWFREAFRSQGLPEDLAYLPHVESSFSNSAKSSVGAAGMWQFMPSTARLFMTVDSAVDERLNPVTAARSAARFFGEMHRKLGSWPLAITSYNHGLGGMCRAKDYHGNDIGRIVQEYDSPSFGFASRNFYVEFLAARRIAKSPDRYFPEGVRFQSSLFMKPWTLKRSAYTQDIGRHLGSSVSTLSYLNPGWTSQALAGKKRLPAGVTVWIPAGKPVEDLPDLPKITVAEKSTSPSQRKHKIASGETLWSIARRYGVSVEALKAENGLRSRSPIVPGNVLELPDGNRSKKIIYIAKKSAEKRTAKLTASVQAVQARTHRVKNGETAVAIASNYRVSLNKLLAVNKMTDRSVIRPGQKLTIPVQQ